jgi:hypothetical protein
MLSGENLHREVEDGTDALPVPKPLLFTSISGLVRHVPLATVEAAIAQHGKQSQRDRLLPAPLVVYFVITLALYQPYPLREVLRCEVLEERVVSSRGLHRPRGVRRQRSDYPNRPRGSIVRETPMDYRAAVVIPVKDTGPSPAPSSAKEQQTDSVLEEVSYALKKQY